MFVCTHCKQGLMDPLRNEEEPEYTDSYKCGHCGHTATIPSLLIIFSQIITALLGGGISLYLMIQHLGRLFSEWQLGDLKDSSRELLLLVMAILLLSGFAYTLFRAWRNLLQRKRYMRPSF